MTIFTPRVAVPYPGETMEDGRAVMSISVEDRQRFDAIPRRPDQEPIRITDLTTLTHWWAKPADCGGGCFCAAEAWPAAGEVNHYFVSWEMDIDAESPEEAAREALAAITRPGSIAHVFEVHKDGHIITVDLSFLDEEGR